MSFTVTLLDTVTGEKVTVCEPIEPSWWSEGNGSCDCNRMTYFGQEPPDETTCDGCHRYLIVGASSREYSLRELNADYPESLLRRWLSKEDLLLTGN